MGKPPLRQQVIGLDYLLHIVEVKAYGHCSLAMPSRCAVGHVRAYLENGTLPEGDVKCDADVGYFERPKEGGGGGAEARAVAVNHARGEEEDGGEGGLWAAQLALARSSTWASWRS